MFKIYLIPGHLNWGGWYKLRNFLPIIFHWDTIGDIGGFARILIYSP